MDEKTLIASVDSDIGAGIYKLLLERDAVVDGTSRANRERYQLDVRNDPKHQMAGAGRQYTRLVYTIAADLTNNPVEMMEINAVRSFAFLQYAAENLLQDGAVVAVLSSAVGSIAETDRMVTPYYRMSKAALNMGIKMLHLQYPKFRWLAIHPGLVDTKMTRGMDHFRHKSLSVDTSARCIVNFLDTAPQFGFWDATTGRRIHW